ncbi:GNAT family N-acetyltransferase [Nocardioides cheoyonin]|uniref:GNAT family N-acetyltransferase n=1 Tax=Nocardioides cheoyonin TaxID=3156615 RepID=UPI0032B42158
MREVTLPELVDQVEDEFVRRQVGAATFERAWVRGRAAVVQSVSRHPHRVAGAAYTCVGPAADLDPLLAEVASALPPPGRVVVDKPSFGALPWPVPTAHVWDWMLCSEPPPAPRVEVVEVADAEAIGAVLDDGNPDSFARPGEPDVEAWLGSEVEGTLAAVGALTRVGDGTGHLRGVTTRPAYRGRGLGAAVSAALTRRAMAPTGVASLGVYVDNGPALAIYRRLGYRTVHTFAAGVVDR